MKPAPFTYHAPRNVDEALDLLFDLGDEAKIIAGGQSLMPMLNYRLLTPRHLVDINRIEEFGHFSLDEDGLRIGALVRQRDLELSPEVELAYPILHEALTLIAHVQIRNRGTICGSLSHADSAAELPSVMVALDAKMTVRSKERQRIVAAEDFFRFHLTSDLEPNELLTEVFVPKQSAKTLSTFAEVTRRKGDFALVGAALRVTWGAEGVEESRIVCSGVAPTPMRFREAENLIVGTQLEDEVLVGAQQVVMESLAASEDPDDVVHYRSKVTGVMVRRSLAKLAQQRGAVNA